MDLEQLKAQLLDLQIRLNAIIALVINNSVPSLPGGANTYPTTEVPPAHDACRPMWEQAQKEGLFNIHDYVGAGLVQGMTPGQTPRMSQKTQDALEASIRALGRSEWGQAWLSDDYNASMIGRRYCYEFVGYWVTRTSHNPDDGFTRHYNAP
jgi:hypothetical protein